VVASFASHVHRIQQVIDIAVKHNRKIALVGRSMVRNMTTAIELGYLKAPVGTIVSADKLEELAPERIVLVSTGSQGEPMAALARMASNDHRISIGPDDTVVLASSLIPGNENSVNRVINGLTRLGAQVVHKGNALVHVSGHAAAGELLYAYNLVKPKNVMPIHGEARHLRANANVAIKTGVLPHRVHVIEDGMAVDLKDGIVQLVGAVDCGYVFVDGASVGDISEVSLKDRRILGEEGFISCVVAVDVVKSKVVAGPEIHARGFAEDDTIFDPLIPLVVKAIEFALQEGMTDPRQLSQVVRRVVGKWVADAHRRKPMIVPVVIEA
jgi:ribonuclease J